MRQLSELQQDLALQKQLRQLVAQDLHGRCYEEGVGQTPATQPSQLLSQHSTTRPGLRSTAEAQLAATEDRIQRLEKSNVAMYKELQEKKESLQLLLGQFRSQGCTNDARLAVAPCGFSPADVGTKPMQFPDRCGLPPLPPATPRLTKRVFYADENSKATRP